MSPPRQCVLSIMRGAEKEEDAHRPENTFIHRPRSDGATHDDIQPSQKAGPGLNARQGCGVRETAAQ